VSNSTVTDDELAAWKGQFGQEVAREQARKAHKKQSQIKQVKSFVWDDRTINRILSKKDRSSVKLTLEIAKHRTQLQAAIGSLNSTTLTDDQREAVQENINRINREIAQLESDYRAAQAAFAEANAHQFGIVAINHRNRTQQRLQDVQEARDRLKSSKNSAKAGELNPFKRRECKPVVMWDVGKRSPKKEPKSDPSVNEIGGKEMIDTPLVETKPLLTDFMSLEQLMDSVDRAIAQPNGRLTGVRENMVSRYSKHVSPVWEHQLVGHTQVGEIMDFAEWKRRVAEDEDVDMQE
jgi:hypothetical protein